MTRIALARLKHWVSIALLVSASASHATPGSLNTAGLSEDSARKVWASAEAFLNAKTGVDRSANDLGWDCMAAAALTDAEIPGARDRLQSIADELIRDVVRSYDSGKAIGWTASGGAESACVPSEGRSANVTATCEGGGRTLYALQAGLGMACLARAGATLRKEYLSVASEVMSYWNRLRLKKTACSECIFFAASDSASDDVRYVRNMNLFIAFGAAQLAKAASDASLSDIAAKSVRADVWERRHGNRGYLGALDPLWSSRPGEDERIENHMASVALLLNTIGKVLPDGDAEVLGVTTWRDWATCDNKRCRTAGCKYWAGDASTCQATATAAHCAFRQREPLAHSQCESYISRVPAVGGYGLWSVLQGGHSGTDPSLQSPAGRN